MFLKPVSTQTGWSPAQDGAGGGLDGDSLLELQPLRSETVWLVDRQRGRQTAVRCQRGWGAPRQSRSKSTRRLICSADRRARCTEDSVQRRLITEDGAVVPERRGCLVRMRPTGWTLKGQTICSPNVRLGKGKQGWWKEAKEGRRLRFETCQPLSPS